MSNAGIKLEIDTNPPAGATLATTFIQHHTAVNLQHHDPGSLLAGKLHAILQRAYVKGRDWYDLFWYLQQPTWPQPNLSMLNNALAHSGWDKGVVTADNWRGFVLERLARLDCARVTADVQPFLINQDDFTRDTIQARLRNH